MTKTQGNEVIGRNSSKRKQTKAFGGSGRGGVGEPKTSLNGHEEETRGTSPQKKIHSPTKLANGTRKR